MAQFVVSVPEPYASQIGASSVVVSAEGVSGLQAIDLVASLITRNSQYGGTNTTGFSASPLLFGAAPPAGAITTGDLTQIIAARNQSAPAGVGDPGIGDEQGSGSAFTGVGIPTGVGTRPSGVPNRTQPEGQVQQQQDQPYDPAELNTLAAQFAAQFAETGLDMGLATTFGNQIAAIVIGGANGGDPVGAFRTFMGQFQNNEGLIAYTDEGPVIHPAAQLALQMVTTQLSQRMADQSFVAQLMETYTSASTAIKAAEIAADSGVDVEEIRKAAQENVATINGLTAREVAMINGASAEEVARITGLSAEEVARIRGEFDLEVARQSGLDETTIARIRANADRDVARITGNPFNFTQEQQIEIERLRATGGLSPEQLLQQERIRAGSSLIPTLVNLRSNPSALGSLVATGGISGIEGAIANLTGQPGLLQDIADSPSGNVPASALGLRGSGQTPQFQSLGSFRGAPENLSAYDIRDRSNEELQFLSGQAAASGITPSGLSSRIASNTPQGV